MLIERVKAANFDRFGDLIKKWALGEQQWPAENDLHGLLDQAKAINCGLTIPDRVTKLKVKQRDMETLLIVLPPAALLQNSIDHLKTGGEYTVPRFYKNLAFHVDANIGDDENNKLNFHSSRVCDYTLGFCL